MALSYCCLGSESELGRVLRSSIVSRFLTRSTGSAARLLMWYRSVETGSGPCFRRQGSTGRDTIRRCGPCSCARAWPTSSRPRCGRRRARCSSGRAWRWSCRGAQTCCGQPGWTSGHPERGAPRGAAGPAGLRRATTRWWCPPGRAPRWCGTATPSCSPARRTRTRPRRWPSGRWSSPSSSQREGLHPGPEGSRVGDLPRLLPHAPAAAASATARARCSPACAALELREMERHRRLLRLRRHVQRQLPGGLGPAGRGEGAAPRPRPGPTSWSPATCRACCTSPAGPAGRACPLRARHIAEVLAG